MLPDYLQCRGLGKKSWPIRNGLKFIATETHMGTHLLSMLIFINVDKLLRALLIGAI